MAPRLTRAILLSFTGLAGLCLVLLLPPYQDTWEELTDEQAAEGRWTDLGEQVVRSEKLVALAPEGNRIRAEISPRALDHTIQRLEAMILDDPENAGIRSNLAYILLARNAQTGRSVDLIAALEQLEISLDAAPELPEVLYNYALTITRLGLRISARSAWSRYLDVDPSSPWSGAARRLLEGVAQATLRERWESGGQAELQRAAENGDLAYATELVATYPTFARGWIEEQLLPTWADSARKGTAGEIILRFDTLRLLGRALAEALHDYTVEDTLASIEDASGKTHELLLEGLWLYGRAMASYRIFGDEREKNALLERAALTLERAGSSPLSRWASLYRAVGWHRTSPQIAREQLLWLAEVTPTERQPALTARIEWMLGTNEEIQNRYERALEHYRRSRERLVASEGPASAAFLDLLIAETLSRLGEVDLSWKARIAAIQGLAPIGDRQRLHAALYSTVEDLVLQRRFAAARPWIRELNANAERWGAPIGLAETALQTGCLLAKEGLLEEAEEAFRQARGAAARIDDASLRRRTVATITLYQAESLFKKAPGVAVQNLRRARPEMVAIGYRFQLPRLDVASARASLAEGDREAAMAALRSSIAEEEVIRREVRDESLRASAFEGAQQAFDTLVGLELDSVDGNARAFSYSEQARARLLLDLLAPNRRGIDAPVDLDRVISELPEETDLLEFTVLPERLVVWRVRRGESLRYETKIASADLGRSVNRLVFAIVHQANEMTIRARSSELWRILLGPIAEELPADRRLVIVPDRFLGRVPFAALFDPVRQRYLLQDRRITIAPSASAFFAARTRRRAFSGDPPLSVVAVGANHPGQVWLPTVEGETKAIGGLYPQPVVLTGEAATRDAFLRASQQVEVLHFAGHARHDAAAPRRSRIFFQPVGPQDSGLLFGDEIAAGEFSGTRLAVVAACRSVDGGATGRETVSGIAAAFLAAGVPTVVASLWDVEDRATGEFMTAFHENIRRGIEPGEALRRAQIDMLRPASQFRSPRFWAGFVVIGTE